MKLKLMLRSLALGTLCAAAAVGGFAAEAPLNIEALAARALVATGDTARLQHVLAKAARGERVTVAVIGGSITAGAKASRPELRYGDRIAAWWRSTFPKADIQFFNAGIGATGSNYGALRAQRDLLSRHPDVVVVEYSVNDGNVKESAESLEGLVRQILNQSNQPAVLQLFMMHQGGGNAQEWHRKVGEHYHLPMISFRDALWPEMQAGKLKWEAVMADEVHPNDPGHAAAAGFVTRLLDQVHGQTLGDGKRVAIKPMPKPLFTDLYEHTVLVEAADMKPVTNQGWTFDLSTKSWRSEKPGSVIEFEIGGRLVFFMDYHFRGKMGQAKVSVDNGPAAMRDGWFPGTWGGYRATTVIARDLQPGTHRVRVELIEGKNPQSEGHEFRILGLGAAGAKIP